MTTKTKNLTAKIGLTMIRAQRESREVITENRRNHMDDEPNLTMDCTFLKSVFKYNQKVNFGFDSEGPL